MRWLCVVAFAIAATGCSKSNPHRPTGEIPDGFIGNSCNADSECDDGDPCTDDSCAAHMCKTSPHDCTSFADDCNDGACDPATGDCIQNPINEGGTCFSNIDFTDGTCAGGVCNSAPQCNTSFDILECDTTSNTVMDDTTFSFNQFDAYGCPNTSGETGPELGVSLFVFSDTAVTLTLSGTTADLDLIVLESSACDATQRCVKSAVTRGTGNETLTFNASAALNYMVIVEGFNGAASPFTLHAQCTNCAPVQTLTCNMSVPGDTTGADATSSMSDYQCDANLNGPELTYQLKPAAQTDYTIKLTGLTHDHDLVVVKEAAGTCDPTHCVSDATSLQTGTTAETVNFSGAAGITYDVIVDAKTTGGPFMLEVDCKASCLGQGRTFGCGDGSDSGRNDDAARSTNVVSKWGACDDNTTGPEVVYQFVPAADGLYTFDLTGMTQNLDLIVMESTTATACDPTVACLEFGTTGATVDDTTPESVTFMGKTGHHYFIAVDGKAGAVSPYTLRLTSDACGPWSCSSPTNVARELSCTWLEDRGRNDDPARSKLKIDAWDCDPNTTGPEVAYAFVAPSDGTFTVTLDEVDSELDLILTNRGTPVLCDPTAPCTFNPRVAPSPSPSPSPEPDPSPSPSPSPEPPPPPPPPPPGFVPETITFAATMGKTYYFVVDGKNGAVGQYHISISGPCGAPACRDGVEDLHCGVTTTVTGSNDQQPGSSNDIASWGAAGCATGTTGPEFAHYFTPNGPGPYTVTLSQQQADLDLIVLEAASRTCQSAAVCVAASQNGSTSNESLMFTADAGKHYWFVVDGHNGATSPYKLDVTGCP